MKKLFFALSLFATSLTYADAPPQSANSTDQSDIAYRGERERGGEGVGAPGRGVTPGVTPGRPGPER